MRQTRLYDATVKDGDHSGRVLGRFWVSAESREDAEDTARNWASSQFGASYYGVAVTVRRIHHSQTIVKR